MNKKALEIMNVLDEIEYGFKDSNGLNIINDEEKWDKEFYNFYYLLTPNELLKKKCGVCWDQVELERKLFKDKNVMVDSYFICTYDDDNLPSHTFIVLNAEDKYYWFEHSWYQYKGIHEYDTLLDLLTDVKGKFEESHKDEVNGYTFLYKYEQPKFHIGCKQFYDYVENCELIKINKPLYFYHVINKDSDLSIGLLSLQYMYDHQMYDLFDKNVVKYNDRITKSWNIEKYNNKEDLSREEYLDALKIFRGEYGSKYLYFFRYPLYKELGPKIEQLLKVKDIYRININDEEVQKNIEDIFYGYDMSNSDNNILTKEYYEKISKNEYFKNYSDNLKMNFSTLNHIGISFKDGYCKVDYLEKIEE